MNHTIKHLALFTAICLLACTAPHKADAMGKADATVTEADLLDRRFVLASVDGKAYALTTPAPVITFAEGMRVSGAICNYFTGQGTLAKGRLTVERMASTRKLCFEEDLNAYEHLIGGMLMNGVDLQYDGKTLIMRGGKHTLVYLPDSATAPGALPKAD